VATALTLWDLTCN